jgi:hypothetical protein
MGYRINAFIARTGTFALFQDLSHCLTIVPMAQGFEMLINEWYIRDIFEQLPEFNVGQGDVKQFHPGFDLADVLVSFGVFLSHHQPIAYIEADFFGGNGDQKAVVWFQGKILLLPERNGDFGSIPDADGPINRVLRLLGVETIPPWDEFVSIGLAQCRDNYDWFMQFNLSPDKDNCHDGET